MSVGIDQSRQQYRLTQLDRSNFAVRLAQIGGTPHIQNDPIFKYNRAIPYDRAIDGSDRGSRNERLHAGESSLSSAESSSTTCCALSKRRRASSRMAGK